MTDGVSARPQLLKLAARYPSPAGCAHPFRRTDDFIVALSPSASPLAESMHTPRSTCENNQQQHERTLLLAVLPLPVTVSRVAS
jgi:hypothetical protein